MKNKIANEWDGNINSNDETNDAKDLFAKLFEARDYFHLAHLKMTGGGSYAGHKALNEAYDGILDLVDGMVESYQGIYGFIDIQIPTAIYDNEPVEYLQNLRAFVASKRDFFADEPWMQNEIDEVQKLIASTLYKMKYLKYFGIAFLFIPYIYIAANKPTL